jgi:hypothetical protein
VARYVPKKSLFPIALSATALARALQIRPEKVLEAVRVGDLPCYAHATAKRVLIEDAVRWVRTKWKRVGESHGKK